MATLHSEFGLPIFIADDGEVPKKGAFFATNNKWTLSKIAKVAYNDSSAWKIINKNGWNTSNLIYRADSTNCSSARRESSWALTTTSPVMSAKSAFIALCQRDAKPVPTIIQRSFKFPVIWIPDLDKMPLPVAPRANEEPPTQPVGPTVIINHGQADVDISVDPGKPSGGGSSSSGGTSSGGSGSGSGGGNSWTTPIGGKPGIGPFILIGGGLLALVGLLLWPVASGKKRKK